MYRNIIRVVAVLFAAFAAAMALPGSTAWFPHRGTATTKKSSIRKFWAISSSRKASIPTIRPTGPASGTKSGIRRATPTRPNRPIRWPCLKTLRSLFTKGVCLKPSAGVAVTPERVSAHDYTVYFGDGGGRDYGLLDLKDKLSYVSNDYRTQDLFRFGRGGIEFLDAPSNRVDTAKTAAFRPCARPVRDSSLRRRAHGRPRTVRTPRRWVIS